MPPSAVPVRLHRASPHVASSAAGDGRRRGDGTWNLEDTQGRRQIVTVQDVARRIETGSRFQFGVVKSDTVLWSLVRMLQDPYPKVPLPRAALRRRTQQNGFQLDQFF
jgi:hypothetical protein